MNKIILTILGAIIIFLLLTLSQGVYYGIKGTPQVILLSPECNSTINETVNFNWKPEPDNYHHYKLQVKQGSNWESDFLITHELNETSHSIILNPGIYQYNVIALNENNEPMAGSAPCKFTVE